MKKKCILASLLVFMLLSMVNVKADTPTINITGSASTQTGCLIISEIHVTGTNLDNLTGKIIYDKSNIALYQINVGTSIKSWDFDYTDKNGVVTYTLAKSKTSKDTEIINGDTVVLNMMFIVHGENLSSTTINLKDTTANTIALITKEVPTDVVLNQAEIDAAKLAHETDETVVIPDPIYQMETIETEEKTKVSLNESNQTVKISINKSSDNYLRYLNVENSSFTPEFSKEVNAYKAVIDSKAEVIVKYEAEDPNAKVEVQDEVNNQVIVTVTARDGSVNTYVLTIIRQTDYNTDPHGENKNPSLPINTGGNFFEALNIPTTQLIILGALALVAVAGFVFGGILISKGAHEE